MDVTWVQWRLTIPSNKIYLSSPYLDDKYACGKYRTQKLYNEQFRTLLSKHKQAYRFVYAPNAADDNQEAREQQPPVTLQKNSRARALAS